VGRPTITFTAIVPKNKFLFALFEGAIRNAMETRVRPELRSHFYKTVEGWNTKVYFRGTIRAVRGEYIRLLVKPYGKGKDIYALVARGARRHPITPRRSEYLRFQEGYISATEPRWIGSRRKQRFGETIQTKFVDHPGFDGRYWDEEISIRYEKRFHYHMRNATFEYIKKQASELKESIGL